MTDTNGRGIDLSAFEGVRLTDVCDGMDAVGLQDVGLMDASIRPLWRDTENFAHRIVGFAHTVKFTPTSRRAPQFPTPAEFNQWKGDWYRQLAQGPIEKEIRPGDIIVIDAEGVGDCGYIGSCNSLSWLAAGALGAVTNGGCRDTDELIHQKTPVYSARIARGIRPGRLELESTMQPIVCGGVRVRPGDIVLADGDGVIVVPIEKAADVAAIAQEIQEGDKKGRRWYCSQMGIEPDWTMQARPGADS